MSGQYRQTCTSQTCWPRVQLKEFGSFLLPGPWRSNAPIFTHAPPAACPAVTALAFQNLAMPTVLEARKRIPASPNGGTAARLGKATQDFSKTKLGSPLEAQHLPHCPTTTLPRQHVLVCRTRLRHGAKCQNLGHQECFSAVILFVGPKQEILIEHVSSQFTRQFNRHRCSLSTILPAHWLVDLVLGP